MFDDPLSDPMLSHAQREEILKRGGGNAAGSFAMLAVVVALFAFYVIAAVSAIVGGVVILGLTRLFRRSKALSFQDAYLASFAGFIAYGAVSVGMGFLVGDGGGSSAAPSFADDLSQIAAMQTLPVLACAFMIGRQIGDPYTGVFGFLRAVVAAAASVFISLIVVVSAFVFGGRAADSVMSMKVTAADVSDALVYIGLPLTVLSLIGGLLVAVLLRGAAQREPGHPTFRTLYVTGVLALLAWSASTVVVEMAGGTIDPLVQWFTNAWAPPRVVMVPSAPPAPLAWLLVMFACAQAAAVAGAAAAIMYRMPRAFAGRLGWLNAYVLALISVAVVFAPLGALVLYGSVP
jgi:hypothetical protein